MFVEIYWNKVFKGTDTLKRADLAKAIHKAYPSISEDAGKTIAHNYLRSGGYGKYMKPAWTTATTVEVRKPRTKAAKAEPKKAVEEKATELYHPDSKVKIDHELITKYSDRFTAEQKTYLSQHVDLFSGTMSVGELREFYAMLCVDGKRTFEEHFKKYLEKDKIAVKKGIENTMPDELEKFNEFFFGEDVLTVSKGILTGTPALGNYKMRSFFIYRGTGIKMRVETTTDGTQVLCFDRE